MFKSSEIKSPSDWSRDGRLLLFNASGDIFLLPVTDGAVSIPSVASTPQPSTYLKTEFNEFSARFSPDLSGSPRFIAYTSNATGVNEIYVQTFPDPKGGKWTVSKGGGTNPVWRRDGKELFYLGRDGAVMAVDVALTPSFRAGVPKAQFTFPPLLGFGRRFDVTGDGQKFAAVVRAAAAVTADEPLSPITVVLNWEAGLKK